MPEKYTDTPLLTARFDEALHYATEHHRPQLRKGTAVPYVAHLLAVAAIVLEMEASEDEAIGALLHDVVEDGGGLAARDEIERRFGPDVARIVLANSDSVDGAGPKGPWRPRKQAYLDAIAHKRPDELRVSLADKLHNARSILLDLRLHGDDLWHRFAAGGGDQVRWYYRSLARAFEARRDDLGPGAAVALDEFRRTVAAIDDEARP
ncbi:HD domain-containing protein [Patulibacter defluvii]|uniref:HD domain-containing protein n=1 Tax=Patulibacter defluvii TaxID=3095358 RepID=UPI002A74E1F5|nr:HD domain-containing protein [Patulibacter sp. DM4]